MLALSTLSVSAATTAAQPPISSTVKGGVTYYTETPYTYKIEDDEAIITACVRDTKGELVIPDTLGGCPVTEIGDEAFYDCAWLTRVTLPDSLRRIGNYAFYLCKDMQAITLGKSVEYIGRSVFTDTDALETITVAADNPHLTVDKGILYSKDKTVLYFAPVKAVAQHTYAIPDGVTTIHSAAFAGNGYLRCVVMPNSVTTVGSEAFLLCGNLESVVLSANLQTVKKLAFWNCQKLRQVFYNGTDAHLAAMVIEDSNQLEDIVWQPIDEDTLQGLVTPPTSATTTKKTTDTTTPSSASATEDTTTTTAATTPTTNAPSKGEKDTATDPSPLPWLIAGVCGGLLIAVSAVLTVVLCRKKK